jgi:hypothetical protein
LKASTEVTNTLASHFPSRPPRLKGVNDCQKPFSLRLLGIFYFDDLLNLRQPASRDVEISMDGPANCLFTSQKLSVQFMNM